MRPYKIRDDDEFESFKESFGYDEPRRKLSSYPEYRSMLQWLSLWSIKEPYSSVLIQKSAPMNLRKEIELGKIPIGPANNKIWERVHDIISSIEPEMEIIPSKIGENLTKISYLENELKKLKEV